MKAEEPKSDTWYKKIGPGTLIFTSSPKANPVGGYLHEVRVLRGSHARSETHQSKGLLTRKKIEDLFADFISVILAEKGT